MAETTEKKAAPVIETVKMDDGRVVDFAGKRKLLKESFVEPDGTIKVRMDFRNGETRTFTVPGNMIAKFAGHGAEQKLGDETAGLEDVGDMVLAVDELMDRLAKGEWGVKREGNGLAGTSVLLRALMELYSKSAEQVKQFLAGKDQAAKIALRNNPKVKPIIERIEAEKAAKKTSNVDTEALLGELEEA
jgi:hypothetical protein